MKKHLILLLLTISCTVANQHVESPPLRQTLFGYTFHYQHGEHSTLVIYDNGTLAYEYGNNFGRHSFVNQLSPEQKKLFLQELTTYYQNPAAVQGNTSLGPTSCATLFNKTYSQSGPWPASVAYNTTGFGPYPEQTYAYINQHVQKDPEDDITPYKQDAPKC